jgi:HAMP domain-containing protein
MSDKEIIQNEDDVGMVAEADASANMATIASKPTSISRSELISNMVAYATKLGPEELADFVARIGSAEEMTKSNDEIYASTQHADGNADKNRASIKSSGKPGDLAMPSIKEDLAAVFGGSEELTEDFRDKVETLFEAAINTRLAIEVAKIEEAFEAKEVELTEAFEVALEESVNEIKEEMVENVDNYLNYAVAEWIAENKLAIENGIKTEIAESFMAGLKNVFEEHYVNIPDDQVDVVEAMATELEELKAQVNEMTEQNIELSKIVNEKKIDEITSTVSEGMTDTQKDKFKKLTEAVSYSDVEEFRKKVAIIKETYFPSKSEVKVVQDQLLSESVEEPEKALAIDPGMQLYVSSIAKTLKKI